MHAGTIEKRNEINIPQCVMGAMSRPRGRWLLGFVVVLCMSNIDISLQKRTKFPDFICGVTTNCMHGVGRGMDDI
jgi:hypothetical protein